MDEVMDGRLSLLVLSGSNGDECLLQGRWSSLVLTNIQTAVTKPAQRSKKVFPFTVVVKCHPSMRTFQFTVSLSVTGSVKTSSVSLYPLSRAALTSCTTTLFFFVLLNYAAVETKSEVEMSHFCPQCVPVNPTTKWCHDSTKMTSVLPVMGRS